MKENESGSDYSCKYVDYEIIDELLYGDKEYIVEFSEAAVESFEEFSQNYKKHILSKDETAFRKAGHKIKPIAQMMELSMIVEEYEHGKILIQNDAENEALHTSADKIQQIIGHVVKDLKWISEESK